MTKQRTNSNYSRRAAVGVTASGLLGAGLFGATPAYADGSSGGSTRGRGSRGVFDVTLFGARGDGRHDDTGAVRRAIEATGEHGGVVYLPPGTYLRSDVWELPSNVWIHGAGQGATTVRAAPASTSVTVFGVGEGVTDTHITDLIIEGDKAEQTSGATGIAGWRSHANTVARVTVRDQNGIGIGLGGCWDWTVTDCVVTGAGNSQPGLWCDVDSGADPYNRGGHRFERIVCRDSDLDGIICNSPNCTIIDSEFSGNGVNVPPESGALGAGGIYNDHATPGTIVSNCRLLQNTEFGVNMVLTHAQITGNIAEENALSGIHVRAGSSHVTFSGNVCRGNGTASSEVTAYSNSGISFDNSTHLTITGNDCADPGSSATQEWGVHALDYTGTSDYVLVVGNTLTPNVDGAENISDSDDYEHVTVTANQ